MAEVKEMVIPLRAVWNVPRTKRANRAMAEIRNHVFQHMKIQEDEEIWIDQAVNEVIWARGMQSLHERFESFAPGKRASH